MEIENALEIVKKSLDRRRFLKRAELCARAAWFGIGGMTLNSIINAMQPSLVQAGTALPEHHSRP
jgi:hypothetical protein